MTDQAKKEAAEAYEAYLKSDEYAKLQEDLSKKTHDDEENPKDTDPEGFTMFN